MMMARYLVYVGLSAGLFAVGYNEGKKTVKAEFIEKCEIPQNYCDPSIKSLEQELKISFSKYDNCMDLIGKKNEELVSEIHNLKSHNSELDYHLYKCEETIEVWRDLIDRSSFCLKSLKECNYQLEECNKE
jgi:hypothetical protein